MPVVSVDGYEADDVIGTLARRASSAGYQVVIVSGDKDFQQLVRPGVWLLNPGRGGPAAVEETLGRRRITPTNGWASRPSASSTTSRSLATRRTTCPAFRASATRRRETSSTSTATSSPSCAPRRRSRESGHARRCSRTRTARASRSSSSPSGRTCRSSSTPPRCARRPPTSARSARSSSSSSSRRSFATSIATRPAPPPAKRPPWPLA